MAEFCAVESIAFWNSGIAPVRGKRTEDVSLALGVINCIVSHRVTMLGLCEIDDEAAERIKSSLPIDFECFAFTESVGRTRWDLGLVTLRSTWRVNDYRPIKAHFANRTFKAGFRVRCSHLPTGLTVSVYLLHWPSGISPERAEASKFCSSSLKNDVHLDLVDRVRVLVMGDFNEESFDVSMQLWSTSRDMVFVKQNSERILFNPFWRHLGYETADDPRFGTHYFKDGLRTRWKTFDQIIVSGDFLEGPLLRFRSSGRVDIPGYAPDKKTSPSNHFPVEVVLSTSYRSEET